MLAYATQNFLSPLEVEELDAIREDEEEEKDPTNVRKNNSNKEIVIITQTPLKEFVHPNSPNASTEFNFTRLITKL